MNSERTRAYRSVIQTLNQLGPSKLLDSEQDRIRLAADSLLFSPGLPEDVAAREALEDIERLSSALVESGRWEQSTASRLSRDVFACGPGQPAELQAA